jgi:hypothetical protein
MLFAMLGACSTSKIAFNKKRLLDASMDPGKSSTTDALGFGSIYGVYEKSALGGSQGIGSSCPTCGS